MPELDLAQQTSFAVRLLVAAVLGMIIGLEREIHEHPAGMRTHLLVSVGSAGFTLLSMHVLAGPDGDPGRVAAQIVSGIGFLGAGAILKEGATIRGLTTAASLWAVAAVGMAAGAGAWVIAIVVTAIVVFSLWPLRVVAERYVGGQAHRVRMQLATQDPHVLGRAVELVAAQGGTVAHLATAHTPGGGLAIDLEIRVSSSSAGAALTAAIAALESMELVESRAVGE